MSLEHIKLLGILDVDCEGSGALTIYSDLPGNAQGARETRAIAAAFRRVIRFKLQGTTKGHSFKFELSPLPASVLRVYAARVCLKTLGVGSDWTWVSLPIPPTSEEWTEFTLPIPPTSEEWSPLPLPIPPTSEEWSPVSLPIPPTSEEWSPVPLPIDPTSEEWTGWPLPIEPTPEGRQWVTIPVSPQ